MAVRTPWVLTDLTNNDTYSWDINPRQISMPRRKTFTYQNTAAPGGRVLAFEGRDEPRKFTFSGIVLSQSQKEEMDAWFNKRHQMQLTDDLGETYTIYITSFNWSREGRTIQHQWRHSYEGEMLVLDWS
jgi:hypothetical protein